MSVVRALVVDDEPLSRRAIRQLLAAHADVTVVGECRDAEEAAQAIDRHAPDLVFLDIRMPGVSGLELARRRPRALPLVVFVTAYETYALPAFDADPVDYITKPVVQARLDRALERVRERLALLARPPLAAPEGAPLVARVRDRDVLIPPAAVDFIEADDVYAAVHAAGKRHLVRTSLDALERELDPASFLRVHRSYIVRLDRVSEIRLLGGGRREVVLATGATVPVSRRRRAEVERRVLGAG